MLEGILIAYENSKSYIGLVVCFSLYKWKCTAVYTETDNV